MSLLTSEFSNILDQVRAKRVRSELDKNPTANAVDIVTQSNSMHQIVEDLRSDTGLTDKLNNYQRDLKSVMCIVKSYQTAMRISEIITGQLLQQALILDYIKYLDDLRYQSLNDMIEALSKGDYTRMYTEVIKYPDFIVVLSDILDFSR